MSLKILKEQIKKFPDTPGVYFFKKKIAKTKTQKPKLKSDVDFSGEKSKILYIGKATSLKDRVKSYFTKDIREVRSPLIEKMVVESDTVEYEETDSVLEALILEANLIKRYQPEYNTKEKDGKSFNYVVITKEEYPRVFTLRGKELQTVHDPDDFLHTFGPYTSSASLREALKIIRKIFPFRGEKDAVTAKRKSRLNEEIGLTPKFSKGVDVGEYKKTIKNIALFFQGKKSQILKNLSKEMKDCAKAQEFERAGEIKRKIFSLGHINDVALIGGREDGAGSGIRIEAYDIAHMSGKDMVGVMTVVEDGAPKKSDYRKFIIKSVKDANDTAALKEVLQRRFTHDEWKLPGLIVVDGGKAQLNACRRVLEEFGYQIPLVSVVKDERHKAKGVLGDILYRKKYEYEILLANSESHRFATNFHRKKRSAF